MRSKVFEQKNWGLKIPLKLLPPPIVYVIAVRLGLKEYRVYGVKGPEQVEAMQIVDVPQLTELSWTLVALMEPVIVVWS